DFHAGQLAQPRAQALRARVRVERKQSEPVVAADVGVIDAGVRGDVDVPRLGDERALLAQHAHALVEHDLDHARVRPRDEVRRDAHRLRAGGHGAHVDEPALGLRHHLLGDDDNVSRLELRVLGDQRGQVVAGAHLGQPLDGDQLDLIHTARLRRARSEGSSRSSAIASELCTTKLTPRLWASSRNFTRDSSPKCMPITSGGWRYKALVPPRPMAGTATTTGGFMRPAAASNACTAPAVTRGRSLESKSTASAPPSTARLIPRSAALFWPSSRGSSSATAPQDA